METADIQKIQARLREINAQLEKLRAEAEELETAVRVFKRFTGANGAAGGPKLGPARPEGLPSLFKMAESVIRDAVTAGKPGLTGAEIVAAIGKRYWPGLKGQQILPSIYGFAKNHRLTKTDSGIFKLPKERGSP
jgi:hypothetical protein